MSSKVPFKLLLLLTAVVAVFHFGILFKQIPYSMVWGGQIQSDATMYVSETISIILLLFFGFILVMKANYIKLQFSKKVQTNILRTYLIIFIINTMGNIASDTSLEKVFSLASLLMAILIWMTLQNKNRPGALV